MKDFPKYLEARAARLKNLYIFLNTDATVEKIRQFKPDIVVNATGSVPLVPPIKGLKENIEAGNVATIFDMINNLNAGKYPDEACQGKKVVVVGGGSVGLDVIEYFAPRGAECTIVDMLPQIGMLADPITKCSMRETHDKYGVREYVNTALQEVKENAFTVKLPDGQIKDLEFDFDSTVLECAPTTRYFRRSKRHSRIQILMYTPSVILCVPAVSWKVPWKVVLC